MDADKTMKIVTNLDRGGIEAKLTQVSAMAQSGNLPQLASLFNAVEGMSSAAGTMHRQRAKVARRQARTQWHHRPARIGRAEP